MLIRTLDAAGVPVPGVAVTVDGAAGVTDARGNVTLSTPPAGRFGVTATHARYLPASFDVQAVPAGHVWSVPGHEVTGPAGSETMTIRLGRLDSAPVVRVGPSTMAMSTTSSAAVGQGLADDIEAYRRAQAKDPKAPLVLASLSRAKHGMTGIAVDTRSDRHWHQFVDFELDIRVGVHPLLKAPDGVGWDKLHHKVDKQLIADRGDLYWVEWGVGPDPRYLAAVWCPRAIARQAVGEVDVVVFYTPPIPLAGGFLGDRSPFRGDYPYTANPSLLAFQPEDPPAGRPAVHHWMQRYVELGHRYLLREGGKNASGAPLVYGQWLAHQLAAVPRHAVLVLPIPTPQPPWPPQTGPGLARLVQEVVLWLYRDGRIGGYFGVPGRRPGTVSPPLPMLSYAAAPKLRELAVAGFSSGWTRAAQAATGSRRLTDPLYEADARAMDTAWRQLWCLDAPALDGWTSARLLDTINGWVDRGAFQREARIYQTTYTGWDAAKAATPHRLLAKASVDEVRDTKGTVHGVIRHRPDGHATLIWFDDHLRGVPPTSAQWPNFYSEGDIHQVVPKVAFGHAASLW